MDIAACIFDMDDLLIRSAPTWRSAEEELLAVLGQPWSEGIARRYKGMNAFDVAATIHAALRPVMPLADCQRLMRRTLIRNFGRDIQPMPGAIELVRRLHGRKPMAVASGSPLDAIRAALSRLGILECFDQVLTSESVARGKPHPDIFLATARALSTPAHRCLVFEDSLIGVRAGIAAGMQVVCIPSGPADEIRRLTPLVFPTLANVSPAVLPPLG